jgi:hypothetical protein
LSKTMTLPCTFSKPIQSGTPITLPIMGTPQN